MTMREVLEKCAAGQDLTVEEAAAAVDGVISGGMVRVRYDGVGPHSPTAGHVKVKICVAGFRSLQLHGEEPPEALKGLPVPAYKAFRLSPGFDCAILRRYPSPMYLLDAYVEGIRGGTGQTCDWAVAIQAKAYGRIMLGGGLAPENVVEAVRTVQPYAIDVNSGVEVAPGIKDHGKIRALFGMLRSL